MNCNEARNRLLEVADGLLPEAVRPSVEEHMAGCAACRAELEELRRASGALRQAACELAPQGAYLTPERLGRLMAAHEQLAAAQEPRIFKLLTYRRFVAAAAAAAIIVSVGAIAVNLLLMRQPAEKEGPVADSLPAPSYVPVVWAATGQGEPVSVIRSIPVSAETWSSWEEPARGPHLLRTDSPGIRIPVDHAFYDPEESSRWW